MTIVGVPPVYYPEYDGPQKFSQQMREVLASKVKNKLWKSQRRAEADEMKYDYGFEEAAGLIVDLTTGISHYKLGEQSTIAKRFTETRRDWFS